MSSALSTGAVGGQVRAEGTPDGIAGRPGSLTGPSRPTEIPGGISVDDRMEEGDGGAEGSAADEGCGSRCAPIEEGEHTGADSGEGAEQKNDGGALTQQG
ncbi:hypothetical protein WKI65_29970 [Streptomyces sp. MS1.AVA.3]|uniref:hypothetical protein n=1 Tax=Streptomyces decoyicus TaxID=249567 RepID=UPI0030BD4A1E